MEIVYCCMTQNRLHEVRHCLNTVEKYVDKMVVVDGGSCDDTIIYMRNRSSDSNGKLHFFLHPWRDNFSEQRTNYLDRAREVVGHNNFWVLVSDPDEWFEEETLKNLPDIAEFCEGRGLNMAGFQCRSVSLKGDKRVWESLDNYWKGLFFKYMPGLKYGGNPHETVLMPGGLKMCNTPFLYEHVKQENVIWQRGARNAYVGGGGPNLGTRNPLWVNLRNIVKNIYNADLSWHEFEKEMLRGNIHSEIKEWMYKAKNETGWDGACFLPGHYVGTPAGFSELNENVGELVLGQWGVNKVLGRKESFYDGKIVRLTGVNTATIDITENHRVLVAERCSCPKNYRHLNIYCRPDCSQSLPKFREDYRNESWSGEYKNCGQRYSHIIKWVPAKDVEPYKHCFLYPKIAVNKMLAVDFSLEKCELLGWYLAEGFTQRGNMRLALNMYTDPIEHISNLVKHSFNVPSVNVYEYPKKSCSIISAQVGKDVVAQLKEWFGPTSTEKHLPQTVFSFNKEQIEAFLKGAISGDGCIYRKPKSRYSVVSYCTASKRLAFDMQLLLSKIGVFAHFDVCDYSETVSRFSAKPLYRLIIEGRQVNLMTFLDKQIQGSRKQYFFQDENFFYLPCTKKEVDTYIGPVYNIETEDNTYLSGFIVHNSEMREFYKYYFRVLHNEEEPEEFRGKSIE